MVKKIPLHWLSGRLLYENAIERRLDVSAYKHLPTAQLLLNFKKSNTYEKNLPLNVPFCNQSKDFQIFAGDNLDLRNLSLKAGTC